MNRNRSWIWLICLAGACGDEAMTAASQAKEGVPASASAERSRQACSQDEADLVRAFGHWQTCSRDDECALAVLDAGCVSPFLCATAFNAQSDRAALAEEARALASIYTAKCSCSEADCPAFSTLYARCDVAAGQCFATSLR